MKNLTIFFALLSLCTGCESVARYQPAKVKAPASVQVEDNRKVVFDDVKMKFSLRRIDTNLILDLKLDNFGNAPVVMSMQDIVLTDENKRLLPLEKMGHYANNGNYEVLGSVKKKIEIKEGESSRLVYTFEVPAEKPETVKDFNLRGHITKDNKTIPLSVSFAGTER